MEERTDLEEVWFTDVEVSIAEEPRYVNELHPEILEDMKNLKTDGQKTGQMRWTITWESRITLSLPRSFMIWSPANRMEIVLPLSVYRDNERYENQELLFTVEGKAAEQIPDQEFDLESCTVKLTEMRRSLTAFAGRIQIKRSPEQQSSYEKEDREIIHMVLEGTDGSGGRTSAK